MNESKEVLTAEEIRKQAYLTALRLKSSGLDAETIYARLEKQGVPANLARQVAMDVMLEQKREVHEQAETSYNMALIRAAFAVILGLVSFLFFRGVFLVAMIILTVAIVSAVRAKEQMKK